MTRTASKQATTETSSVPPLADAGPSSAPGAPMDPAQRHMMIAEAAFFIAQARDFTPSQELDDWLAAERTIERRLSNPDH
jgi:hypothetical protein